ncbi:MAG: hypothetical protein J0M35_16420, partial [Candidatus Obscuribacter phosphatis]|nr:hypothetical protein [Candidatus Obscuribacter phosphatis]
MSFNFLKKGASTNRYPTDILIGELFVKAGIITQKQLDDTIKNTATKHLHMGQMLTMAGLINHRDLQAAVDAQAMLRDKIIEMPMAARCLKIAVKTGASFSELVREEQAIADQAETKTNRLGELLMDANIINKGQFGQAMGRSLATGLPLGRILVLNNSIPDSLLRLALELQVRVRDGMIERDEAIDSLRAEAIKAAVEAPSEGESGDDSFDGLKPVSKKKVRIGELLVKSGFLNETDVISCLELGLSSDRQIGEVMVEQGYISFEMLNVALAVQQCIEEGRYNLQEAAEAIKLMQANGRIFPEIQDRINGTYVPPQTTESDPGYSMHESPKSSSTKLKQLYDGPELHGDFSGGSDSTQLDEAPSLATLMRSVAGEGSFDEPQTKPEDALQGFEQLTDSANDDARARKNSSTDDGLGLGTTHDSSAERSLEDLLASAESSLVGIQVGEGSFENSESVDSATESSVGAVSSFSSGAFESLLLASNVVNQFDIEKAFALVRETPEMFVDVLKLSGLLTEVGKNAVLECYRLVKAGELSDEHGVQVLDYCINQGRLRDLTLEGAMLELGWTREESADSLPVEDSIAADAAACESINELELKASVSGKAVSVDSMEAEAPQAAVEAVAASGGEVVDAAETGSLLSLFGLSDENQSASLDEKADENLGNSEFESSGPSADSLIASLATQASPEAQEAEEEAARENAAAFETTAVFKQVSDSEVEAAASKALDADAGKGFDEGLSLDSLLDKLQDEPEEAATPVFSAESVSAEVGLLADGDLPEVGLGDLISSLSETIDSAVGGANLQDELKSAVEAQTDEDVDLRSLFSGLGGLSEAEAEPAKSASLRPAPAPTPAPAPAPTPAPAPAPTPAPAPAP